jgi:hypothetical protein
VVQDLQWGSWSSIAGWTALHHLAEALNTRHVPQGWIQDLDAPSFVASFLRRGGLLDARIGMLDGARRAGAPGFGNTALHMLCRRTVPKEANHEADVLFLARVLLENRADPEVLAEVSGRTPLTIAMNSGRVELACLLVEHGADPDQPDGRGETVWASAGNQAVACRRLRQFVADRRRPRAPREPPRADLLLRSGQRPTRL